MTASPALMHRLAGIRLLALDVDGVLTDGSVWHSSCGQFQRFHVHDGLGLQLLGAAAVTVVWISARRSEAVELRAAEIGVADVRQGVSDKLHELQRASDAYGVGRESIAYMGDDLPDLPALRWASIGLAPANAVAQVRAEADYVCERDGGEGAVREVCDLILAARQGHSADRQ